MERQIKDHFVENTAERRQKILKAKRKHMTEKQVMGKMRRLHKLRQLIALYEIFRAINRCCFPFGD